MGTASRPVAAGQPGSPPWERAIQAFEATARRCEGPSKSHQGSALRRAIADLLETFGPRYPRGDEFLARLDGLEKRLAAPESRRPDVGDALRKDLDALRREALVANPLVSQQPILFVVRHPYRSHYHAIDTLFHTGEMNADLGRPHDTLFDGGGTLKAIDFAHGGRVRTLVDVPAGVARDPAVHFSGEKIVFALRRSVKEDYHLWEVRSDGGGLHQLTSAAGVSDFDPLYLPDERIAFSSTREPKYNMCSRDHGANLFCMEADGANIHQIGKNNLFDNQASLTPDGRILYSRWEYVDRNFGDAHSLWTINPDGTNQAVYWGNNTAVPGAVMSARAIPGTQQVLCIFGPPHAHLWGAMAIVDRRLGLDGRDAVVRLWPSQAMNLVRAGGPFDCDAFSAVQPKYMDPYPLSDKYFLCARSTEPNGPMGLYLVDVFGNELLLHREGPGCYDPMPLGPRPRPPLLPARRDFENREGTFYVADVYRGTHMQGVKPGAVKTLRVVESPEKRHWSAGAWFGQGYTAPAMNWHSLENKRILGSVPVEADGSAYFAVPAETFVYFQLLDENGMMIQSMRSGASVQSGEHAACVGCHDERRSAPPASTCDVPLALRRPPSRLAGWYGPAREFSFMTEVQPVFTRHCVACHDYGKPAGKKLNLAPDRTLTFNTAYTELWHKGYLTCVGAGPAEIQQAYSWGSHASRLTRELCDPKVPEHKKLNLSAEERNRLLTWVDLNGVYYPTYASAYPDSLTGRVPLDAAELDRLSRLTGVPLAQQRGFNINPGQDVSFDRPELSPCLAGLDPKDDRYKQSLAILQAGKERLARRGRGDELSGFVSSEADQRREIKYAQRRQIELDNRDAIVHGRKAYDH